MISVVRARTLAVAFVASVAFGVVARAQSIQGSIRDATSDAPIPGVVVLALDSASTVRSRVISDGRGEYRIAGGPLVRTLRFLRIGFSPEERHVPGADTSVVKVNVAMRALSQMLAAMQVRANPSCPRRADRELAFSLWDQVRTALLAAVVSRETNPPRAQRVAYKRVLSEDERVLQQFVQLDPGAVTTRTFVPVLSSEDFVRGGFSRDTSGMRSYLVPYADVLLDDAFMSGHCFQVVNADSRRAKQVGLGFETARRRRGRVDVDGVLWVDTAARVLVDLEFRYVGMNLPDRVRAGGAISFRQMTNGLLIIDRWHIRGAGARERPGRDELGILPAVQIPILATQYGGELVETSWPDGSSWHAPLGKLVVRGADSLGNPISGFEIRLRGTNYVAHANDRGILEMPDVLPGPYRAIAFDPLLGRLGLAPAIPLEFTAQRDAMVEKTLTFRNAIQDFRDFCSSSPVTDLDDAVVVIRVRTPDGEPVSDAAWEVRRERDAKSPQQGPTGSDSSLVAFGQAPSPDGTLNRCLKLKKGDVIRVKVWRDGRPPVVETRVLTDEANVVGVVLPPS
jgi:hypothetical protein